MRDVEPQVYKIVSPQIDTEEMLAYLREVGGESWFGRVFRTGPPIPDAEGIVEFMGRLCYRSWEPGLNRNVTRIREDHGDYLLNILRQTHGSVIEHAHFTFVFHNVSRVLTAELNRHRLASISEQSLRFVRLDDVGLWLDVDGFHPDSIAEMKAAVEHVEGVIAGVYARELPTGGDAISADFARKKFVTSRVRRIAPMGIATEEGWTANVRMIRHLIEMRTAPGAEEEIRIVADKVARKMTAACPALFGDYEQLPVGDGPPHWQTPYRKV